MPEPSITPTSQTSTVAQLNSARGNKQKVPSSHINDRRFDSAFTESEGEGSRRPQTKPNSKESSKSSKTTKSTAKRGFEKGHKGFGNRSGKKSEPLHTKLGIQFSIARLRRYLRNGRYSKRVGGMAPVFLAAVMDYLISELIVVSSDKAKELGALRVKPRHIQLAIRDDKEFSDLLDGVIISQGGVVPLVHDVLKQKSRDSGLKGTKNSGKKSETVKKSGKKDNQTSSASSEIGEPETVAEAENKDDFEEDEDDDEDMEERSGGSSQHSGDEDESQEY